MKIAVLAGGFSPEREVSLTSGTLIANTLIQNGHRVAMIDVYIGTELADGGADALFRTEPLPIRTVGGVCPDLAELKRKYGRGDALIGENVIEVCRAADLVFPALHGGMGENGLLQATLETFGIRHAGSDYAGCLLSMDKHLSKQLFRGAGILTPDWVYFDRSSDIRERRAGILNEIGIPCVVKPCGCGSSVGVTIVESEAELDEALEQAERYDTGILAESKIIGRELTVGVLDGRALPVIELVPPKDGFYDYRNKYSGATVELCPAPIPAEIAARVSEQALRGMEVLRLGGYARFDFILDEKGDAYCLEANALPGMTPTSLLPRAAEEAGISYGELCETIVRLAGGGSPQPMIG